MSRITYDREHRCVKVRCAQCGAEHSFKCNRQIGELFETGQYRAYCIQDIIPQVSPDIREMFISGMCGKCWDKMFEGFEDDE